MYSAETEARLQQLTAISQERELTTEEAREALTLIRQDRVSASYASKGAKEKKVVVDPSAAFDKLKAMFGPKA